MSPSSETTHRRERWLPILAAILAVVAFLPALRAGFVNWDDEASFLTNTAYPRPGGGEIRGAFTPPLLGRWSPMAWLTWSLNYVAGGLEPWGYHLGNLVVHSASVALLWLIAQRLIAVASNESPSSQKVAASATIAALIWGLHPLHAEAVAWASARRDLLCGFFYLLAVLAYLRGVAGGAIIERRWLGLSLAGFAAALSSKSIAVTLPLSLLLLDVYPLGRRGLGWRILVREKLPYAALAAAAGIVAFVARQETGNITRYAQYGPGARLACARPRRAAGARRLRLVVFPQEVPLADRALADVRAAPACRSRSDVVPGRGAGRGRGHRGARPASAALARPPRGLGLLAHRAGPDQRSGPLGQPAHRRSLQLPLEPGVRDRRGRRARLGCATRGPRVGAAMDAPSRLDCGRAGGGGARNDDLGPDRDLEGLGDALATSRRGRSRLLPLREQSRPRGGAPRSVPRGRGARGAGHHARPGR